MGVFDTLRSRGLPQTTYPLRAVPSQELAAAQRELADATAAVRDAEANRRVTSALKARVGKAQERLHACYVNVTIKALPPDELEDLVSDHKPTEDDPEGSIFHRRTFAPALVARCVYDDPEGQEPAGTVEQWAAEMGKSGSMSLGEVASLFDACWQINDRTPDPDIPKG